MALFISEKDGVIEVREEIYGFRDTTRSWSYYDLQNRRVSSHGRQGDIPDRPMTQQTYDWALKHYVPKIATYVQTPEEFSNSPELAQEAQRKEMQRRASGAIRTFEREANAAIPFEDKCRLRLEEMGTSVKVRYYRDAHSGQVCSTADVPAGCHLEYHHKGTEPNLRILSRDGKVLQDVPLFDSLESLISADVNNPIDLGEACCAEAAQSVPSERPRS